MTTPDRYSINEEVGADDAVVVAEQVRPRRPVEPCQSFERARYSRLHVVSAGGELPERRSAHDERRSPKLDEVGEVRRPVGELQHPELAVEVGKLGPQVALERGPVELLARSDRRHLVRHDVDISGS